ncbi:MAG: hypothetical protein J7501_13445, partial [Bdellovibrio sp.]|nr:hypothetical protein [Bdellovibrio sp.]
HTGAQIDVNTIKVELLRPKDVEASLPKAGREVYISVVVSLLDNGSNVIRIGNDDLRVRSQIAIYPREVGSFALLVARDLHLELPGSTTASKGDVYFHKFANKKTFGTGQGLVFTSPVFVNQDIYLPYDTGDKDSSSYTPVTFADRVYMGNGWILDPGGKQYVPVSAGGMSDRFWTDSNVFGGFLRGIENDGSRDAGLDVFSGQVAGVAVSAKDAADCSDYINNTSNVKEMGKSEFSSSMTNRSETNALSNYRYRVGLTKYNYFSAQENTIPAISKSKYYQGDADRDLDGKTKGAIAQVAILYGTGSGSTGTFREVTSDLNLDGELTIQPQVGSTAYLNSLTDSRNKDQMAVTTAKATETSLKADLTTAKLSLKTAKNALSAEEAKPVKPVEEPVKSDGTTGAATETTETTGTGTGSTDTGSTGTSGTTGTTGASTTTTTTPTTTTTTTPKVDYQDPEVIATLNDRISSLNKTIGDLTYTQIPDAGTAITDATTKLTASQSKLESYQAQVANPPKITVDLEPVWKNSKRTYADRIDVKISIANAKNLIDASGNLITNLSIKFRAYDGTYWNSSSLLDDETERATHLLGYLNYTVNANGSLIAPDGMALNSTATGTSAALTGRDSAELAELCETMRDGMSSSFGGAAWGTSFAASTRKSWNFAGNDNAVANDPVLDNLIFSESSTKFLVRSIVGNCVIQPNAKLVTGFFTCDKLTIQARSTPLRIIGTFIVKSLVIEPEAYKAGITWSTIYHPQAAQELRKAGILKPISTADITYCDRLPSPIWHPKPSIQETADRLSCNVISLRAKADPFQWTSVDPDCGFLTDANGNVAVTPTCKRRLVRYFVVEQSREGTGL